MDTQTAPLAASGASRRRPGLVRLRAGLLVLCIPFLSLALVFTTPTTAQAFDGGTKLIQGGLKSPPARLLSWTPAGRAITIGLGLGMLAYETRDHWWPIAADLWNPKTPQAIPTPRDGNFTNPQAHCSGAFSAPLRSAAQRVQIKISGTCLLSYYSGHQPEVNWRINDISCRHNSTGNTSYFPSVNAARKPGNDGIQTTNQPLPKIGSSFEYILESPDLCSGWADWSVVGAHIEAVPQTGIKEVADVQVEGLAGPVPASQWETTTTVRCKNPDTGAIVGTVTATLSGDDSRLPVPSCSEEYPGSIPWDGSVTGGSAGSNTPQGTFATDEELFEEWRDCFGPTGVLCKTEVYVDGQRCTIGKDVCVIWWRIWRGEPERIDCKFGTHVVPIGDCMPLKRAYGTGTSVQTLTDVQVITSPEADPDAPPAPNPTASPSPSPSASPTPTPSSPPTTGPNPEVPAPAPPTPETNPDSRSCYGDAWGWNPIDWVYIPVKCALKWAFVPKTSVQVRTQRIGTAYDLKFPFTVPAMVGGMGGSVGGGCPDWNVIVEADTWDAVCDSPFTAAIRGARGWLTGGMLAAAFWPLVRGLFFASVPVIKPTPTDSK